MKTVRRINRYINTVFLKMKGTFPYPNSWYALDVFHNNFRPSQTLCAIRTWPELFCTHLNRWKMKALRFTATKRHRMCSSSYEDQFMIGSSLSRMSSGEFASFSLANSDARTPISAFSCINRKTTFCYGCCLRSIIPFVVHYTFPIRSRSISLVLMFDRLWSFIFSDADPSLCRPNVMRNRLGRAYHQGAGLRVFFSFFTLLLAETNYGRKVHFAMESTPHHRPMYRGKKKRNARKPRA